MLYMDVLDITQVDIMVYLAVKKLSYTGVHDATGQ